MLVCPPHNSVKCRTFNALNSNVLNPSTARAKSTNRSAIAETQRWLPPTQLSTTSSRGSRRACQRLLTSTWGSYWATPYIPILSQWNTSRLRCDAQGTLRHRDGAPPQRPSARGVRYTKSKDEIVPTLLPQKDLKDRYLQAICQVSLRTLHEVFTADRTGQIHTIALTVDTEGIDSATGLTKRTSLVIVAADRSRFQTFDLANVLPQATLQHLGALISKVHSTSWKSMRPRL